MGKMFKLIILCLCVNVLIPSPVAAQSAVNKEKTPFYKHKTTIKLSYTPEKLSWNRFNHWFGLEGYYGLTKWLDVGAFVEYNNRNISGNVGRSEYGFPDRIYDKLSMHDFNYGASANIHLLPLIVNPEFYAIDVFLSSGIGASSSLWRYSSEDDGITDKYGPGLYYNVGLGVAYNFVRYVGIYTLLNYEKQNHWELKVGLNVRF